MVKVCDAVMGAGKSSAAINFMNANPDRKFIYITPYLNEAERIVEGCPGLNFQTPRKITKHKGSKLSHTAELVREGFNVATTHQAFKSYNNNLLEDIRNQKYILVMDENTDMLEIADSARSDAELLERSGLVCKSGGGEYVLGEAQYSGGVFDELVDTLGSEKNMVETVRSYKESFFYWQLSPSLITAFDEVYVLTYLFEGQSLYYFFEMNGIPYKKIGIDVSDGNYEFSDSVNHIPDYIRSLSDKIHILDNRRLNEVGDGKTALSVNWLRSHDEERGRLKNNVYNYFRNISNSSSEDRMWSTYSEFQHALKGNGYSKSFVPFNARATNEYRNKTTLAYCVNIYMNVGQKLFYESKGVKVDEDMYALSTMVQWVWRSAIRDGGDIYLYLPSKRMRRILTDWINSFSAPDSKQSFKTVTTEVTI